MALGGAFGGLANHSRLDQRVESLTKGIPGASPTKAPGEAEQAAQQFESLLVQQMLQSMWKTVPEGGLLSNSSEEKNYYRDMLSEALANNIADGQGIGVKEVILKDMVHLDKK